MRNKLNLSLSPALIKENYKMYWYLPVLSFIAYFMAGIFPLIMNPRYLTDPNHWYLEGCLQNYNVAFVCLLVAAGIFYIGGCTPDAAHTVGIKMHAVAGL